MIGEELPRSCQLRVASLGVSPNSWLAVDAGTTPLVRAQELRFAWERWMADSDDEDPAILREAISDSWRRSSAAGGDPTGSRLPPPPPPPRTPPHPHKG